MNKTKNNHKQIISQIYKKMNKSISGGRFRKTVFHVHTPESYDFKLISDNLAKKLSFIKRENWREYTLEELFEIAKYIGLFVSPLAENKKEDFEKYLDEDFTGIQELLAYLILGHSLLKEEIELCLITDHNTIKGFKKIKKAIDILLKQSIVYKVKTRVELGIEISCSDKNHIVGILDQKNEEQIQKLEKWMDDNILSVEDGTIRTSFDVFELFNSIKIIGYIAHINTSDIFKSGYLSGTYKKQLFGEELFNCIGITDKEQESSIKKQLKQYGKKDYCFIIDNDAHDIERLESRSFFLKADKLNFTSIKTALNDYKLSISFEEVQEPKQYIKCLYIEGSEFLSSKNRNSPFMLTFSSNMNAFVGGRGTGKSTVLNTLGLLTSQYVENEIILEKLLSQGTSCIVYSYEGEDFYIIFNSSDKNNNEVFSRQYFFESKMFFNTEMLDEDIEETRKMIFDKRIQVCKYNGRDVIYCDQERKILERVFTRKYTTNELVNVAEDEEKTTKFIEKILFENKKLKNKRSYYPIGKGIKGLISKYDKKEEILNDRKEKIVNLINDFNSVQNKKLMIRYTQKKIENKYYNWYQTLGTSPYSNDKYYKQYAISNLNLISYLSKLSEKLGNPIEVLKLFYDNEYLKMMEVESVNQYFEKDTFNIVNNDLKELKKEQDFYTFFEQIRKTLMLDRSINYTKDFLKNYFFHSDEFSLLFNVNNKESVRTEKIEFREVTKLSMGQKVVALLSFLLSYSEYSNDFSPFVIDQPEDNLDNQYIYKNLVNEFRKLKSSRQIIIASHNSTIVMNSGCEQVIIMNSDNDHGWCETTGYSSNPKIINHVINILEGGNRAISDKLNLYKNKLKSLEEESVEWNFNKTSDLTIEIAQELEKFISSRSTDDKEKLLEFLKNTNY